MKYEDYKNKYAGEATEEQLAAFKEGESEGNGIADRSDRRIKFQIHNFGGRYQNKNQRLLKTLKI